MAGEKERPTEHHRAGCRIMPTVNVIVRKQKLVLIPFNYNRLHLLFVRLCERKCSAQIVPILIHFVIFHVKVFECHTAALSTRVL